MSNIKKEKGITLFALIITIIVLLILAVVSIRAIQGDGILGQARRARDEYSRTQDEEISQLKEYEQIIAQQTGKAWVQGKGQNGNITFTKEGTTVQLSDYIRWNRRLFK